MPKTQPDSKHKLLAQRAKIDEQLRALEAEAKTKARAKAEADRQKRHALLLKRLMQEGYGDMDPEDIITAVKRYLGPGLSKTEQQELATILEECPTLVLVGEDGQPLPLPPSDTEGLDAEGAAPEPVDASAAKPSSNGWFRTREVR